ncbi:MAG: shikimate kinase [Actinobacteria bacterium]|nr:shikimate kinase [Actinomycetota bacterium]
MFAPKRIRGCILIGPPGAGKSTVGGLLARDLGLPFLDTDIIIEESTGKKVSQIFIEDGEAKFREIEESVVLKSIEVDASDVNRPIVLALGGGSILSERVQKLLKERDDIVYLDVSLSSAAPRVGFNRERPLLMVNPRQQWQELMNRRRPIYISLASVTVDTNEKSPKDVALEIEKFLEAA